MIFQAMSLEEARSFYNRMKLSPGALSKIGMDDIWFFTDGLTKDYGSTNKKIKEFVKIGHKFTNLGSYNPREALLYDLSKAIKKNEFKSDKLKLEFKTLQFNEYPNGKAVVDKEYRNKAGELYWCGTKYDTIDELFEALSEQKYFEVLTVEEE